MGKFIDDPEDDGRRYGNEQVAGYLYQDTFYHGSCLLKNIGELHSPSPTIAACDYILAAWAEKTLDVESFDPLDPDQIPQHFWTHEASGRSCQGCHGSLREPAHVD